MRCALPSPHPDCIDYMHYEKSHMDLSSRDCCGCPIMFLVFQLSVLETTDIVVILVGDWILAQNMTLEIFDPREARGRRELYSRQSQLFHWRIKGMES